LPHTHYYINIDITLVISFSGIIYYRIAMIRNEIGIHFRSLMIMPMTHLLLITAPRPIHSAAPAAMRAFMAALDKPSRFTVALPGHADTPSAR
jgi:hypothetical protein